MGLFPRFTKSNVLYFPGCTTFFKFKENFELYKKIFNKLGIDFREIDKKICSGLPALEAGYEKDARKIARRNFEIFKEEGISSIITNSPGSYKIFLEDYEKMLPDWNIEIKNVWELILERLERKPRLIKFKAMEMATFHDSCYLSRYCRIYDEPRKILELIGYQIKEMSDSKMNSICCGSCGGLPRTNPELANEVARQRILQAKRAGVKKIIVASMDNYALLKKNSGTGMEIVELSDVLALALGIKKKKIDEFEKEPDEEEQIILETEANINIQEELKDEEEPYETDMDWDK